MTKTDLVKFSEIMTVVAEDFGGTLSAAGMESRFRLLQEYSIDQVSKAGTWLLKNREKTFPAVPTTKEFIDAIEGMSSPKVTPRSQAEIQVDIVLHKLKYFGRSAPIDFEHPITFKLMTTRWPYGTWSMHVKTDELKWFRKEFIEAFIAYSEVEQAEGKVLDGPQQLKELADMTVRAIQ